VSQQSGLCNHPLPILGYANHSALRLRASPHGLVRLELLQIEASSRWPAAEA
jgi:hypothetical protein